MTLSAFSDQKLWPVSIAFLCLFIFKWHCTLIKIKNAHPEKVWKIRLRLNGSTWTFPHFVSDVYTKFHNKTNEAFLVHTTLSVVIVKTQFPIEANGETSKFLQRTLCKCCFAGEKIWKSSDCVTKKNPCGPFAVSI